MKSDPPQSDAILERLKKLHTLRIDLSLGRIERLLKALGNPERHLPSVIHIAGTNGKGSTAAFLKAITEAAGLRPHVYTSPHLVRFSERIRPGGLCIDEDHLADILAECETANAGYPISFFEITTAAAFLAFSRTEADVTLLETGLGGRLDATNVIPDPAVTIVTPISLDHQNFLGRHLADIAGEKAGILKRGSPAVIGPQNIAAARILTARAKSLDIPVYRWGQSFHAKLTKTALTYRDATGETPLPLPALAGKHQAANAAMAIVTTRLLRHLKIDDSAIARGIETVRWPARLQPLDRGPLVAPLRAKGFEVILDGGHNPAAGRALARSLKSNLDRPLYLVVAMLRSKDPDGFLKPLCDGASGLWAVPIPGRHFDIPPAQIAGFGTRHGVPSHTAESVADALTVIARQQPGRVLITGSLYLAGAVLAENGTPVA